MKYVELLLQLLQLNLFKYKSMAKTKSSGELKKINFGKRKGGAAQKSFNKHVGKPKKYRGQGR